MTKKNAIIGLFLFSLLQSGCVGRQNYPLLQKLGGFPSAEQCRIAVLPFQNNTSYTLGGIIVYRLFEAELARKTELDLVQEGDVRHMLRQIRVPFGDLPDHEQKKVFTERVEANMIVEGVVTEMQEKFHAGELSPSMSIQVKLVNARSGATIFSTYHRRTGNAYRKILHFGKINTVTELTKIMSREIINLWDTNGFNNLCQKKY